MRRKIRKIIEAALALGGMLLVFAAILSFHDRTAQIAAAALGVLLLQASRWKVAEPILPSEREYQSLRREVDHFILLVRRLNAAAIGVREADTPSTRAVFAASQERMRESFERMAVLAGKTDEEVAALNLRNVGKASSVTM